MPDGVAAERDAQHEVLLHTWGGGCVADVAGEVVDELRAVCSSTMEAAEHILCVARVTLAPGFVVEFVDEAGAVVALVEGRGYQARVLGLAGVPRGYDLGRHGRHGFFGLQARVEQPEAGDGGCGGGHLGEAVDGDEDAGDGEGLRGDGGGGGRGAL